MKKTILSLVVILGLSLTSLSVSAQKKDHHRGFQLGKELNLTADQAARLKEIKKDFNAKIIAIKSDTLLSKEESIAKMKTLGEQYKADSKAVLTPEQIAKVKTLINDKPIALKDRSNKRLGKRHHWGPRPNHDLYRGLDLTAEQKEKIKTLTAEFRVKSKELADQRRASINEILTPDQQSKLKERQEKIQKKDRKDRSRTEMKKAPKGKDKV